MYFKYSWLAFLLTAVCVMYSYDYYKYLKWDLIKEGFNIPEIIYTGFRGNSIAVVKEMTEDQKMFTEDELKKHKNLENGIYLAILGQVFDTSKGAKYYSPEGSYHSLTGRDASLSFVTGDFNDEGPVDDVTHLSPQEIKGLDEWVKFYHKNYNYKGKLIGRYYNEDGSPTADYYKVQQKLQLALKEQSEEEQRNKMFPPCNIEWKAEVGTRVWCSNRSGGITRDWIGVPRMLFEAPGSTQFRCACVNTNSKEYNEIKGRLREYSGCGKSSINCIVKIDT